MNDCASDAACSEDTNSVCNEERIRKLFQLCDTNGDGYIDSHDLQTICRELNMEDALEEIMVELGADDNGLISYEEFLHRRLALRTDIEELKRESNDTPAYNPDSSDYSLGGVSNGKDMWEFDSGARDLSPFPNTSQRLAEAAGGSVTSNSSANLLHLANKLHMAAVESLKEEIAGLKAQLTSLTEENQILKAELNEIKSSSGVRAMRVHFEEQITELHSVIAELTKKSHSEVDLGVIDEESCSEAGQSVDKQDAESHPDETPSVGEAEQLGSSSIANTHDNAPEVQKKRCIDTGMKYAPYIKKDRDIEEILRCEVQTLRAEIDIFKHSLNSMKDYAEGLWLNLRTMESMALAYQMAFNKSIIIISLYSKRIDVGSFSLDDVWCCPEDVGLRDRITDKIENLKSMVRDLKPLKFPPEPSPPLVLDYDKPTSDLETAVLVQALTQEQIYRLEFHRKVRSLEKERDELRERISHLKIGDASDEENADGLKSKDKVVDEKDKYKSCDKLRLLENEFAIMVDQHSTQVNALKNRIKFLEGQLKQQRCHNYQEK